MRNDRLWVGFRTTAYRRSWLNPDRPLSAQKATSEHLLCKDRFWRLCDVRWLHKVAGSALKSLKIFRTGRYQRFMFFVVISIAYR
jgi:hypothetical protein